MQQIASFEASLELECWHLAKLGALLMGYLKNAIELDHRCSKYHP